MMRKPIFLSMDEAEEEEEALTASAKQAEEEVLREAFRTLLDTYGWKEISRWLEKQAEQSLSGLRSTGTPESLIRFYQGRLALITDLENFITSKVR